MLTFTEQFWRQYRFSDVGHVNTLSERSPLLHHSRCTVVPQALELAVPRHTSIDPDVLWFGMVQHPAQQRDYVGRASNLPLAGDLAINEITNSDNNPQPAPSFSGNFSGAILDDEQFVRSAHDLL